MDKKTDAETFKAARKWGLIHFSLFVILILAGIICKRVFLRPELMMLFHGPAAIFLGLAGSYLTLETRRRNKELAMTLEKSQ